jgi:hypothetical protein
LDERSSTADNRDSARPIHFVMGEIQSVNLTDSSDYISRKLTTNGQYSAASAYAVQFIGRIERPELSQAWKIRAEGKINFFIWLLLRNRLWTADRLLKRGWDHGNTTIPAVCAIRPWKPPSIWLWIAPSRGRCGTISMSRCSSQFVLRGIGFSPRLKDREQHRKKKSC